MVRHDIRSARPPFGCPSIIPLMKSPTSNQNPQQVADHTSTERVPAQTSESSVAPATSGRRRVGRLLAIAGIALFGLFLGSCPDGAMAVSSGTNSASESWWYQCPILGRAFDQTPFAVPAADASTSGR